MLSLTRRVCSCARGLLFATLPLMAHAPVEGADDRPERQYPYVRAFTGVGVSRPSALRIHQPTLGTHLIFERVSWAHKSLSTDWDRDSIPYVGVRGGVFLRRVPWLGLSAEVLHFKVFAETETVVMVTGTDEGAPVDTMAPMNRFVQAYQVSNGVNLVLANVEAHKRLSRGPRFPNGRADVYAGGGGGVTFPFTRSSIAGRSQGQYEWGRPAGQVFGGIAWYLSPRWDVSLEYKFTATTADGSVAHGESESKLRTHHVAFGVGFHFSGGS